MIEFIPQMQNPTSIDYKTILIKPMQRLTPFTLILLLILSCTSLDPPQWPQRFTQSFVQGDSKSKIYTSGQIWYDIANNRQRCQVKNDYFDMLCSTVSQSKNSTCSQVIMNDKLYIWLPDQNQCCMCCTAQQGCKITPRDWLKDYEFIGARSLNWDVFNAWTHYDLPVNTTYYATMDDKQVPRKMDMGSYGIDFMVGTYSEEPIPDAIFNLPSSCSKDCPKTSFCTNFRQGKHQYRNIFAAPKRIGSNIRANEDVQE